MLSRALTSWLLEEATDAKAIEVIAKSDILRSEAAMMMPAMRQAALTPATLVEIRNIIGMRFATYPQPERDEGEAAAFWADYFDALQGLTPAQIEGGMKAHVQDPKSEFLPKPGRLADLARQSAHPGKWTRAHNRARAAVEKARALSAPAPVAQAEKPDPAVVKAQLAETLEKLTARDTLHQAAKKARRRPTPSAPLPAGSYMSAAMRAKLEAEGAIAPQYDDYRDRAA